MCACQDVCHMIDMYDLFFSCQTSCFDSFMYPQMFMWYNLSDLATFFFKEVYHMIYLF